MKHKDKLKFCAPAIFFVRY